MSEGRRPLWSAVVPVVHTQRHEGVMSRTIPLALSDTVRAVNIPNTVRPVILIGFQVQANLGIGYLASLLRKYGYSVLVFDFESDRQTILDAVRQSDPLLVGLSLIFQFYVYEFRDLAAFLRQSGVTCHFTIGGHFPSLNYQEALDLIPQVDSVVRFEGEMTLLELADRL